VYWKWFAESPLATIKVSHKQLRDIARD